MDKWSDCSAGILFSLFLLFLFQAATLDNIAYLMPGLWVTVPLTVCYNTLKDTLG